MDLSLYILNLLVGTFYENFASVMVKFYDWDTYYRKVLDKYLWFSLATSNSY